MVAGGEADAAAIDSNVLRTQLGSAPELGERLRVVETWGSFPVQPVVLRSGLHPELKERLRAVLLALDANSYLPPPSPGSASHASPPSPTSTTPPRSRPCESARAYSTFGRATISAVSDQRRARIPAVSLSAADLRMPGAAANSAARAFGRPSGEPGRSG